MLDLGSYLARIGYTGSTGPSAATLCALHRAHMLAVPFENLDIHLGRKIICGEDRFLRKIVNEHRGGFCYELNGAFAALLRALGFHVTLHSARVTRPDGSEGPEFDHLCLCVRGSADPRGESWLADVGFGDSFVEPLRMQAGIEQGQFGHVYRLAANDESRLRMETIADGKWTVKYSFSLQPRELSDFSGMCHYHQTSPDSHFTQQRICSLATAYGRITLSDLKLIETRDGKRKERVLGGEEEWRSVLRERFQITLPDSVSA